MKTIRTNFFYYNLHNSHTQKSVVVEITKPLPELKLLLFWISPASNEVKTNVYERVILKGTSVVVSDGADICNDTSTAGERMHVALLNGLLACVTDLNRD